jgi:hypothetical protein
MALRVVGPAGGELVAAVFAAQDGVGPLPEFDELCGVFGAVKADPVGGGGAMLAVAVAGFGRGAGEFRHLVAETLDFGKCDQLLATPTDISGRVRTALCSSLAKMRKSERMMRFPDKEAVAGSSLPSMPKPATRRGGRRREDELPGKGGAFAPRDDEHQGDELGRGPGMVPEG